MSCLTVKSRMLHVLQKIIPDPFFELNDLVSSFWQHLSNVIYPLDIVILLVLIYVPVPLCRILVNLHHQKQQQQQQQRNQDHQKKIEPHESPISSFEESYIYHLAHHISVASRLATTVYAIDSLSEVLVGLGFSSSCLSTLSASSAKVLYLSWAASRLSSFKKYLLSLLGPSLFLGYSSSEALTIKEKARLLRLLDRVADGAIFIGMAFFLMDVLEVEMGISVSSVLTFGSVSTFVVGLASRDLASDFVSGIRLWTSDRFQEGQEVRFGDGTVGIVSKIGWTETVVRGYDNILEVVPNSLLGMQRVKNISRTKMCQVKQILRFRYVDAEKLPQLMDDILIEIRRSCPEAIVDGTKPYRAYWNSYQKDHLEVKVNTHYHLKATGQAYCQNRQRVMMAIHRAVQKNDVQFVTTWFPNEES